MSHSYSLICPMRTMIHMILNEGILGYTAPFSRNWVSTEVDWHLAQLAEPLWTPVMQREPGTAQHGLTPKKWIVQSVVHKATQKKCESLSPTPIVSWNSLFYRTNLRMVPTFCFFATGLGDLSSAPGWMKILNDYRTPDSRWINFNVMDLMELWTSTKKQCIYCFTFHVFHVLGGCPANFTQKSGKIPEISGPAAAPRAAARPRPRPVRPPVSSAKALRMMWGGTEMEMCTGHMCKYIYIYLFIYDILLCMYIYIYIWICICIYYMNA